MQSWLTQKLNQHNHHLFAWLVTTAAGLLFFYEFFQLNNMNSLSMPLMHQFHLSGPQLSHLSICYFISNACLVFIAGNLLDRYHARRVTLMAMATCILGTALFAAGQHLITLMVARFIIGIGGAFCFLSGMKVASRWFQPKQLALATGVLVTMAMLGGMLAQAPFTALIQWVGWRDAMWVNVLAGCVIFAIMCFFVHDNPYHHSSLEEQRHRLKHEGLRTNIGLALRQGQNWLAAIYTCTLNLPIFILGALWGSLFLQQSRHFSPGQAASICGMLYMGTLIGSPLAGAISDKWRRRQAPMVLGALLSLLTVSAIIFFHGLSAFQSLALFFLLGFVSSTQVLSYPMVTEKNKSTITATAVSIVSMLTICGGVLFQPLFAYLMAWHWNHRRVHGVAYYAQHDYQTALMILPVVFIISLLCALCLKESHCTALEEHHNPANDPACETTPVEGDLTTAV